MITEHTIPRTGNVSFSIDPDKHSCTNNNNNDVFTYSLDPDIVPHKYIILHNCAISIVVLLYKVSRIGSLFLTWDFWTKPVN